MRNDIHCVWEEKEVAIIEYQMGSLFRQVPKGLVESIYVTIYFGQQQEGDSPSVTYVVSLTFQLRVLAFTLYE